MSKLVKTTPLLKIRELPRYEGIAKTLQDFFVPDDAKDNEILVRRGLMIFGKTKLVECLMAYSTRNSPIGWNLLVMFKYLVPDAQWEVETDYLNYAGFKELYIDPLLT